MGAWQQGQGAVPSAAGSPATRLRQARQKLWPHSAVTGASNSCKHSGQDSSWCRRPGAADMAGLRGERSVSGAQRGRDPGPAPAPGLVCGPTHSSPSLKTLTSLTGTDSVSSQGGKGSQSQPQRRSQLQFSAPDPKTSPIRDIVSSLVPKHEPCVSPQFSRDPTPHAPLTLLSRISSPPRPHISRPSGSMGLTGLVGDLGQKGDSQEAGWKSGLTNRGGWGQAELCLQMG